MVSNCRPVCVSRQTLTFKTSQGYVPDARWYDFSYRTHDFEPFASSCLGHPNRLTLLSITGMSSVGWLGDRDLPMYDNLRVQKFLMDGWNGITQRMLNVWGTCM